MVERRALAIFLAFQRDTGHVHPDRDTVVANYRGLPAAMGKREVENDVEIAMLWCGVGSEVNPLRTSGDAVGNRAAQPMALVTRSM